MTDLLSWELLATYAGASAAVMALTQVCKHLVPKTDPKWFALGLALIVSLGVYFVAGDLTAAGAVMAILNAVIITGASIGTFEGVLKPILGAVIGKQGENAVDKEDDNELE